LTHATASVFAQCCKENMMSLHRTPCVVHVHSDPAHRQAMSGPDRLSGASRREWERSTLENPALKGSRLHLARVLLEEFCWGKCYCYPGDELLARKCGIGTATVTRCLRDLTRLGVICVIHAGGRRRIILTSHPHAATYLRELGADVPRSVGYPVWADHPDGPADQSDGPVDHPDGRSLAGTGDESHNHAVVESSTGKDAPIRPVEPPVRPVEHSTASLPTDSPAGPAERSHSDLAILVARAVKQWSDASPAKVEAAVAGYGPDRVEIAVFGVDGLRSWRGVIGALQNWERGPDGPTAEEVKRARARLAAAKPTAYHQTPHRTAADREQDRAAGAALRDALAGYHR
jgi:hypothetical protein